METEMKVKYLLNGLENIISKSEEVNEDIEKNFASLYMGLPEIEENIEINAEEANMLLDFFIKNKGSKKQIAEDKEYGISATLSDINNMFQHAQDHLFDDDRKQEFLHNFLSSDDSKQSFNSVLELITRINIIIEDLNDIVINSIIFASRFEEKGKAFMVIANEINRISSIIDDEINNMDKSTEKLRNWFVFFKNKIDEIIEKRHQLLFDLEKKSKSKFNRVNDSLAHIDFFLKDLVNNIRRSLKPVQEIMLIIQEQDIIRQNIENFVLIAQTSYEKNDEFLNSGDSKMEIDIFLFNKKVLDLSIGLAENIRNQLNNSSHKMEKEFLFLKERIIGLNEDSITLHNFFAGTAKSGKKDDNDVFSSLNMIFNDIFVYLKDFLSLISAVIKEANEIRDSNSFGKEMKILEDNLLKIEEKSEFLIKVALLVDIEIERIANDDSSLSVSIKNSIDQISDFTKETRRDFMVLKKQLNSNLDKFNSFLYDNNIELRKTHKNIEESLNGLKLTRKLIKDAVSSLAFSIDQLNEEIISKTKLIDFTSSIDLLDKIHRDLCLMREDFTEQNKELLNGNHNLKINDQDLKELSRNFTSFLERKTANEVLMTEEEIGGEGGELTLF